MEEAKEKMKPSGEVAASNMQSMFKNMLETYLVSEDTLKQRLRETEEELYVKIILIFGSDIVS